MDTTRIQSTLEGWCKIQTNATVTYSGTADGSNLSAKVTVEDLTKKQTYKLQIYFNASNNPESLVSVEPLLNKWIEDSNALLKASSSLTLEQLLESWSATLPAALGLPQSGASTNASGAAETAAQGPQTAASVRAEISAWIARNPFSQLKLAASYDDQFQLNFTVSDFGVGFQILFTSEWSPMIVMSDHPILAEYISNVNVTLDERSNTPNPMKVTELFDACSTALGFEPNKGGSQPADANSDKKNEELLKAAVAKLSSAWGDFGAAKESPSAPTKVSFGDTVVIGDEADKEKAKPTEEKLNLSGELSKSTDDAKPADADADGEAGKEEEVFPTEDEWNNIIIPRARKYLQDDNFQFWEVEEWMRLLDKAKSEGGLLKGLEMLRDELLTSSIPDEIRKYIPKYRTSFDDLKQEQTETTGGFDTRDGSPEATKHLLAQWKDIQAADCKSKGFFACPIGKNLYLWNATLFNFDLDSPIGRELMSHALSHHDFEKAAKTNRKIEATDVLFELKFPRNYPTHPPHVRLIHPKFIDTHDSDVFDHLFDESEADTAATTSTASTATESVSSAPFIASSSDVTSALAFNSTTGGFSLGAAVAFSAASQATPLSNSAETKKLQMQNPLTSSALIFKTSTANWNPNLSLIQLLERMRKNLEKKEVKVDLESTKEGLPTVGGFWKTYKCTAAAAYGKTDGEMGGKIFLPISALEDLYPQNRSYGGFYSFGARASSDSPMIFEISNDTTGRRSFCGVLEFTAPEGSALVPKWMMDNIGLHEGEMLTLRRVKLPHGTFAKLQPHYSDFLSLSNPKAMLEWRLRGHVALTKGDAIEIEHNGRKYKFNILTVTPGRAISITDMDLSVDFAEPLVNSPERAGDDLHASKELAKSADGVVTSGTNSASAGTEGVDFKTCSTCRRQIPIATFAMHDMQCPRINYFCEKCNVAVKKVDRQKHEEDEHAATTCQCGTSMEKRLLNKHKKSECPLRKVSCQFCELQIPFKEHYDHENKCGSITEECPSCKKRVARRDAPFHKCDGSSSTDGPKPATSTGGGDYSSYSSTYSRPRPSANEALFVCEVCRSPLESFDDLQVHMLTAHYDDQLAAATEASHADTQASAPVVEEKKAPEEPTTPATPTAD